MHMLMSGDRCGECYGTGKLIYDAETERESQDACVMCRGTGREMSTLCRELFDVLEEHFVIVRR